MTKNPNNPHPPEDDDRERGLDRFDADPPNETTFPYQVKSFRELLAELIAKLILSKRRDPKNKNNDNRL
jgi:hypothetical protein